MIHTMKHTLVNLTIFWPRLCPFVFYNYGSFMSFRLTSSRRTSANLWLRKFLVYECGLSGYLSAILLSLLPRYRIYASINAQTARANMLIWLYGLRWFFSQCIFLTGFFRYQSSSVARKCKQALYNEILNYSTRHVIRGWRSSRIRPLFVDANEAPA